MTTGATLSSDGRLQQRLRAVTEPAAAFQNYIISNKQSSVLPPRRRALQNVMDRCHAETDALRDRAKAFAGDGVRDKFGPAARASLGFGPCHVFHLPLAANGRFKLGNGREYLELELASRRRHIEALVQRLKGDALALHFPNDVEQINGRPRQAIKLRYQKRVAIPHIVQELSRSRSTPEGYSWNILVTPAVFSRSTCSACSCPTLDTRA